jgi:hypothetical protein
MEGRPGSGRPTEGVPVARVAEPPLSDDITVGSLDPEVRRDLRGLQKDTADSVARHLVAAGMLVDEEPELALEHARFARTRASRIAVVREAAGIAAYHAGEWSEALGELRAARRMGGGPGHLAVMADIERALGRPERALELSRGPEVRELDRAESIELAIVAAGARRDLGELDAAVVGLQIPELDPARREPWSARLFYAHADNLLAAGREADSLEWFVHAAHADANGETGADLRIAELTGEPLPDDDDVEFGPEELEGLAAPLAGLDGDAADASAVSGADLDEAADAGERPGHPAEPTDALDIPTAPTAPADSAGTAEAAQVGDALEVGDASEVAIEGDGPAEGEDPPEGGDPIVGDGAIPGDGPAEGGDPIVGDGPIAGGSPTQGDGRTGAEPSAEDAGPTAAHRPIDGDGPIVGEATIEGEGRTGSERSAEGESPIVAERPIKGAAPILDNDTIEDEGLAEAKGQVAAEGAAEGKDPIVAERAIVGEVPIADEGPVEDDGVIEGDGEIGNEGLIEDRGRDAVEGEDAVEDGRAVAGGDAVVEDGGAGEDGAEKAGGEVRDVPDEPDVSHVLVTRRDPRL